MDILAYAAQRRGAIVANTFEQMMLTCMAPIDTVNIDNLVGGRCNFSINCVNPTNNCSRLQAGCCWTSFYCNAGCMNVVPGRMFEESPILSVVCAMECLDSLSMVRSGVPIKGGFKVCSTEEYFRCGACCLWTVPSGVTRAQFQLWGAGGGTSSICCCGGSPFGPSGAYATVTIPVTEGCQYTLCAGCAYCCYADQSATAPGCQSFVTGPGLCNFCAAGGNPALCSWGNGNSACSWQSNRISHGFNMSCGVGPSYYPVTGYNFCYTQGGSDSILREYEYARCAPFYGCTTCNEPVYGFFGMNPMLFLAHCNFHDSWTIASPIFGYLGVSRCAVQYFGSYTSGVWGACGGSCLYGANGGALRIPGQGGWPAYMCGGGTPTSYAADAGRMGMVCVTFC